MRSKPISIPQIGSNFTLFTWVMLGFPWFMCLMEMVMPFPRFAVPQFPFLGACLLTFQALLQIGLSQMWRIKICSDSIEWGCILCPRRIILGELEAAYESGDLLRGLILVTPGSRTRIVTFLNSQELTRVRLALADKLKESPPVQDDPILHWGSHWPFIVLPFLALSWIKLLFELSLEAAFNFSRSDAKAITFDGFIGHDMMLAFPLFGSLALYSWIWIDSGTLRLRAPLQFLTRSKRSKTGRIVLSEIESIESKEEVTSEGFSVISSMSLHVGGEEILLSSTAPNFPFVAKKILMEAPSEGNTASTRKTAVPRT